MPLKFGDRSRVDILTSIGVQAHNIKNNMRIFSDSFNEFSIKWLLGVEANYKEFRNYLLCSIKKHEENKKSE